MLYQPNQQPSRQLASQRRSQWWSLLKPQAVVCAVIAMWDYIHFRDLQRLLLILAIGQADLALLKSALLRFLHPNNLSQDDN
jgi:hypothetical protein